MILVSCIVAILEKVMVRIDKLWEEHKAEGIKKRAVAETKPALEVKRKFLSEKEAKKSKRKLEIELDPKNEPLLIQTKDFLDLYGEDGKIKMTAKERQFVANDVIYSFIKVGKFGKYVDVDAVVEAILDIYNIATIFGKKSEEIWCYENGIYKLNGREKIQTKSEDLLDTWAKTKVVSEILNKIKRKTAIDREVFDHVPRELLPLKNGVLNFETNIFSDYSPKFFFKTKIPINFNLESKANNWIKFVDETFYPEDVKVIQEWFGFCLYRDYFIKKGFIGVGEGDTGKSVFQNVLLTFFGTHNTSGLNLQKITTDNNFSKSSLYNKYVNLYDDMSSKDINEGGGLKMVTGRSPITAEYKFGDEFQFINFAKMTFCCNKVPPINDTDDITYYNRWLPISFDNIIKENTQDKFLSEKLTTPEELSGILNWALEGLKRILKNNRFSYNKSPEEIKEIMDRSSHPIAEFVQDCLVEKEGSKITKEVMFQFYTEWAKRTKKQRETKVRLGNKIPRYAIFILDRRKKERYWGNVSFREKVDEVDGILKTLREQGYNPCLHKISKKVSTSSTGNSPQATLDTTNKKIPTTNG